MQAMNTTIKALLAAGQAALHHRAHCNGLAVRGRYSDEMNLSITEGKRDANPTSKNLSRSSVRSYDTTLENSEVLFVGLVAVAVM